MGCIREVMYCVHAPVLHATGQKTCMVTTPADECIEWNTPTVRWNPIRRRLESVDERGDEWMKTLRKAERDVLFAFHRAGYESMRRSHWSDIRRWLTSSVDASGKSVVVCWKEPPTKCVLLRTRVRLEKVEWGNRSSVRVRWVVVPDAIRWRAVETPCFFLPDQMFLFANEVDQLLSLASEASSSASLKNGSSGSASLVGSEDDSEREA